MFSVVYCFVFVFLCCSSFGLFLFLVVIGILGKAI